MELIYAGSVKNVYTAEAPERLWFEYTDDYSVFDWGKMPDPIASKGETLAKLGEWFFTALADPAWWERLGLDRHPRVRPWLPMRHHLLQREGNRLLVQRVSVPKLQTQQVGGTLVYDYGYELQPRQLIPLEVIFRFGVPAGSSLLKRKDWYPFDIHEGAEFDEPLIEFSTKLESTDRMVSYQEAALILKGRAELLAEVYGRTYACALFLHRLFGERGLKLWDGKLEWAFVDGKVTLVDSIGPDELRVGLDGAVFSKQFLRDYYLGTEWEQAVQRGKQLARQRGTADWKSIVTAELGAPEPPHLSAPHLEAAQALYGDFHTILVERRPSDRFVRAVKALQSA